MIFTTEEIKIITILLCEHKADTNLKLRKVLEKRRNKDKTTKLFIKICENQIKECEKALETRYENFRYIPSEDIKNYEIIYKVIFTKLVIEEYSVLSYNGTSTKANCLSVREKRSCISILNKINRILSGGKDDV